MTDAPEAAAPPRRISRKGLYVPLGLFAGACLVWTGLWVYGRGKAEEVMDAWMAREARLGRTWTCPSRSFEGYPFRMQISCAAPTFATGEPGRAGSGSLAGLTVVARIADPKHLIAIFKAPLTWQAAAGDAVEITFEDARASYRGAPGAIDQASFQFEKPVVTYRNPAIEPQTVKAAAAEFHLRRSPGETIGTDLALTVKEVEAAALNLLLGEAGKGALDLRASLVKLPPTPPRDWRATLEDWRTAGGEARIDKIALSKGAVSLDATGTLRLDDLRRLQGMIEGQATGAQQILARLGMSVGGGAGGLLGALVQGNPNRANAQPRPLPVSLRFEQGRLFFGPIPGPRLAPLY